jgi:hypothetical protein
LDGRSIASARIGVGTCAELLATIERLTATAVKISRLISQSP